MTTTLTASAPTAVTQMVGSGLIGVREGLETGIVVMILVAFLVRSGRRDALRWVWFGVGAAVAMTLGVFLGIHYGTSTITGLTAEAVAGVASLVAVVIVTSMVLWMRSASRHISGDLKRGMSRALARGGPAVALLSFLAVGREGFETALLMVGYAENASGSSWPLLGLVAGILVAVGLTVLLYRGAISIDFAKFFRYTGAFLVVVAAGILGYGVHALQTVGWLDVGTATAFDFSAHYDPSSWYGSLLGGIFNIVPSPSVLRFAAWAVYLVVVLALFLRPVHRTPTPASPAASPARSAGHVPTDLPAAGSPAPAAESPKGPTA